MDTSKYNEDLWDEIPGYAFMTLGRRGREQISLFQCFKPTCACNEEEKLHPIKKKTEIVPQTGKNFTIEYNKYLIHCDSCDGNFHLVFEKHLTPEREGESESDEDILIERVYASDGDDQEDYGEIGFVQPR
jgi:hypothetical protein